MTDKKTIVTISVDSSTDDTEVELSYRPSLDKPLVYSIPIAAMICTTMDHLVRQNPNLAPEIALKIVFEQVMTVVGAMTLSGFEERITQ